MKKIILFLWMAMAATPVATATIYVKTGATGNGSSWGSAYGSIGDALYAVGDGNEEIYVASGTYPIAASLPQKAVKIYGGFAGTESSPAQRAKTPDGKPWEFANATVVDASGWSASSDRIFADRDEISLALALDGLTFRGRSSTENSPVIKAIAGLVMRSCIVENNASAKAINEGAGGAVQLEHGIGDVVIEGCAFIGNKTKAMGGAIHADGYHNVYISGCLFRGNSARNGGGIVATFKEAAREVVVSDCEFLNDSSHFEGGAIEVTGNDGGKIYVKNSIFAENYTGLGGNGSYAHGTAIYRKNGSLAVDYCTFVKNGSAYSSFATVQGDNVLVANSILVGNASKKHFDGSNLKAYGNLLDGASLPDDVGSSGLPNILYSSNKPLFTDFGSGDYTLADSSQAKGMTREVGIPASGVSWEANDLGLGAYGGWKKSPYYYVQFAGKGYIVATGTENEPGPPASNTSTDIPLNGNTWITSGHGSINRSTSAITWPDTGTVYTVYFRVNAGGDLRLYLRHATPRSSRDSYDRSVVTATVGPAPSVGEAFTGAAYTITLPKSPTPLKDTIAFLCELNGCPPGYLRVDLKGLKRVGGAIAVLKALVADGEAAQSLAYSPSDRTNAPSVHLRYGFPEGKTVEWFYNEVTVPDGMDHPATFCMVNGFREGYSGIQPNREEGTVRALFSVWAPYATDDPATIPDSLKVPCLAIGDSVCYQQFGGEGSGTQTFYQAVPGWQTDATYKFLVRVCPATTFGFTDYEAADHVAYFFDPAANAWKLIAHLRRPKPSDNYKWYSSPYSFLENFIGESGNLTRKAYFGNQWVRTSGGEWIQVTGAYFTTDATGNSGHRLDYKGGVEDGKFFLQNGGFFSDNATPGAYFTRPTTGIPPDIDFDALEQLRVKGAVRMVGLNPTKGEACD
jgi:hypothetical protein